ncbi:hypothetical protein ACOMHN_007659 [Nucella lapillus]
MVTVTTSQSHFGALRYVKLKPPPVSGTTGAVTLATREEIGQLQSGNYSVLESEGMAESGEPAMTNPAESGMTDPAESEMTDPAESEMTDPAESEMTDPAESGMTDLTESGMSESG